MQSGQYLIILLYVLLETSCKINSKQTNSDNIEIIGTWQLLTSTTIAKGKSLVIDYTKGQKMIKIINGTHFAFLKHSIVKDAALNFDAGGGTYTLNGNSYTEHLDFYNDRNWEGKTFKFKITIKQDTLIQSGLERVEKEGIDRIVIEKYKKLN